MAEEEKQDNAESMSESEKAISDMYIAMQKKYEDEHKLRLKAEADIVSLTKVIRTMDIPSKKDEQEETFDDLINKLF